MQNPFEAELAIKKTELEQLTTLLEQTERDFIELNGTFEQFQLRYSSEVIQKQVELNRLNTALADVTAQKVSYGQHAKQKKIRIETSAASSSGIYKDLNLNPPPNAKEAKKLYRKIASIIHPDKTTDVSSRPLRTTLMAELNEAYERKDTPKMQRILDQWNESPESVIGEGIHAQLERTHRTIVQIKKRIVEIETAKSRIITSELFLIMVKVQKADKEGKDILAEMSVSIDAKIRVAQNTLVLKMYG